MRVSGLGSRLETSPPDPRPETPDPCLALPHSVLRQPYHEPRVAGFRRDAERAAVLSLDQAAGDVEAEPRALADVLGGEEGLPDPVEDLGRDAAAVVAHFHLDAVTVAPRTHLDAAPQR